MYIFSRFKVFLASVLLVSFIIGAALLSLHLGTIHAASGSGTTSNWYQAGYNPQHTCVNPNEHILNTSNVSKLTLAWSYTTKSDADNGEAIVNGIAYVTSLDGSLYAFDAKTGTFKWRAL